MTLQDEQFLRRAIRLAMNGRGGVEPNPMVGCVIVKDGRIIGEGFHRQFGGPHAEPEALASCIESPAGSTAYVTLEPCCHTNKKTPPCAPRLIGAKVARVVIGCLDPNPQVDGNGVRVLRAAGIEVTTPVLESESKQLIAGFIARTRFRRPYVTLKWAGSADGKVAGPNGRPVQISGPESGRAVHDLRSRCDGILVGVGTVLSDNPLLNARLATSPRHPARFVLDSSLRTPPTAAILRDGSSPTTILHSAMENLDFMARSAALAALGARLIDVPQDSSGRLSLPDSLRAVAEARCFDLLVEPGPTLAGSFFATGSVDRVWVFRSPSRIDDPTAPSAAAVPSGYVRTATIRVGDDQLVEYLNPQSDVYFGPHASADVVMLAEGRGAVVG